MAFGLALAGPAPDPAAMAADRQADVEAGRALYLEGRTAAGAPLAATTRSDVQGSGANFACVNCHRPSGLGASEGNTYVLPVTGHFLFAPRELDRTRNFGRLFHQTRTPEFVARMRQARMRPAYTQQTLVRALREGLDPAGQAFDPVMPRYDISERDVANLAAYLRTLSARPDPGIDAANLHLATIVSDTADASARAAMLKVMQTYVDWLNLALANDRSRGQFSPYYHSDLLTNYRRWQLHVWELRGPPASWPAQLERKYREQPVFFVASGLVDGPWSPMADFCDRERLPCLFPNTELPGAANAGKAYSFYFSRGLELEGQALAIHLARTLPAGRSMAQIHVGDAAGLAPAHAFATTLRAQHPQRRLQTVEVKDAAGLEAALRRLRREDPDLGAVALWPGAHSDAAVKLVRGLGDGPVIIALPSAALPLWRGGGATAVAARSNVVFAYPYELPSVNYPRAFVIRSWMRSYGITLTHPRLQLQTYYTMTLADVAFRALVGDYYRDYFAEFIESEAESNLNPGTHRALALGPGQRYASKGAFVVAPEGADGIRALSEWIIP
jgi:cytochrome c553